MNLPEPTDGRPADPPPTRTAGGWEAWQAPGWRPGSSNALLGRTLPGGTQKLNEEAHLTQRVDLVRDLGLYDAGQLVG